MTSINPQCIHRREYVPMTVRSDYLLRPCNFLAIERETTALVEWCTERGADARSDLNIKIHDTQTIYQSKTWTLIQQGFHNGDPAPCCRNQCSGEPVMRTEDPALKVV